MGEHRTSTISDVAAAAGVSIRTVSHVINNSPLVAAASRIRVQQQIAALNFRPSSRARALASGRSSLIGVVQDGPNANVIGVFQRGIVDICAALGYELAVHPARFCTPDLIDDIENFVVQSRIDDLILLPPVSELSSIPEALSRRRIPDRHRGGAYSGLRCCIGER